MSTPQYLMLKAGGVRARMSILGNAAAATTAPGANMPPSLVLADWRAARHETFLTVEPELWQGFNTRNRGTSAVMRVPVWSTWHSAQFRDEMDAHRHDDVRIDNTGWFCDEDQIEKCVPVIARLTHDRWMAGYRMHDSGERVYFAQVFDSAKEAARFADGEAEALAEFEYEYNVRWNAAQALHESVNDDVKEVRTYIKLRNMPTFEYCRDDARELLNRIRTNRAKLANDYSDIEV